MLNSVLNGHTLKRLFRRRPSVTRRRPTNAFAKKNNRSNNVKDAEYRFKVIQEILLYLKLMFDFLDDTRDIDIVKSSMFFIFLRLKNKSNEIEDIWGNIPQDSHELRFIKNNKNVPTFFEKFQNANHKKLLADWKKFYDEEIIIVKVIEKWLKYYEDKESRTLQRPETSSSSSSSSPSSSSPSLSGNSPASSVNSFNSKNENVFLKLPTRAISKPRKKNNKNTNTRKLKNIKSKSK